MNKVLVILLLSVVFVSSSCTRVELPQGSSNDAVFIKMTRNGISTDSSEVVVKNFHEGTRAEIVYRIHNATGKAIMPEIFLVTDADVANYSKADGAVKSPAYIEDWIRLPTLTDVVPGQIKDFIIALEMPKGAKKPANKIGFQIGIAGKTEDKVQTAIGIWWLINFR